MTVDTDVITHPPLSLRGAKATKQSRAKPATMQRDRPPLTFVKVRGRDDKYSYYFLDHIEKLPL